jgi:hypothetical protein
MATIRQRPAEVDHMALSTTALQRVDDQEMRASLGSWPGNCVDHRILLAR